MLEGGNGLDITANKITLKKNIITSNSEDAISLKSNDVLNIENNNFTHSNPLDLRFPTLGVRSITLRGIDLKRPKTGFLHAKVLGTLMIDSCKLSSDSSGGGGWMTGGCVSCSARFSLLFSGFVGL